MRKIPFPLCLPDPLPRGCPANLTGKTSPTGAAAPQPFGHPPHNAIRPDFRGPIQPELTELRQLVRDFFDTLDLIPKATALWASPGRPDTTIAGLAGNPGVRAPSATPASARPRGKGSTPVLSHSAGSVDPAGAATL